MTYLAPRSWFLTLFSNKKNQVSLEKWLILGLGKGKYQIVSCSLQCQKVILEVLKEMVRYNKDIETILKELPVVKAGAFEQYNK